VIGGSEGSLSSWNLADSNRLSIIKAHSGPVNSVQMTSDGRYAVSGSNDTTVKICDLQTGACIGSLEGHKKSVQGISIERNSALIASVGFTDHTIRLRNGDILPTNSRLKPVSPTGSIRALAKWCTSDGGSNAEAPSSSSYFNPTAHSPACRHG
jgi:WD40 repeat protein